MILNKKLGLIKHFVAMLFHIVHSKEKKVYFNLDYSESLA